MLLASCIAHEGDGEMNRMELVDSHAHLDFGKFDEDRNEVLERAWNVGVRNIVTIGSGDGVEGNFSAVSIAAAQERIWAAVGVHPHDANLGVDRSGDPVKSISPSVKQKWETRRRQVFSRLSSLALHPKVVAIGEVGLDFYYDHSARELQRELFRQSVRMAVKLNLPLVIHARSAEQEVARILREEHAQRVGGVIHCFSGDPVLAEAALDMGFYFGLTGILTFPSASSLREIVRDIPIDRLVVETDSPYLAPVPHRGKRNEPSFVIEVARELARVKGVDENEVGHVTSENARRLFGMADREKARPGAIAYRFKNSLYLNITNRCTMGCRFCIKNSGYELGGYKLGLQVEPDAEQVLAAAEKQLAKEPTSEVVFCGLGEPLLRPRLVAQVGRAIRSRGLRVRVNTDGLANLVHGRDVAFELRDSVDAFSISLNAHDAKTHDGICPNRYGMEAFAAVVDFVRRCSQLYDDVTATVVADTGVDDRKAAKIAQELGVKFRIRG